jgi:hypothetical protein
MLDSILGFFQKPETWRFLIGIITAAGVVISTEQANAIIAAGVALMGAVGLFTKKTTN